MSTPLGPRYRRLGGAMAASSFSGGLLLTTLPLLAATATRSTILIGAITTLAGLPWLTLGLVSGAIADRFERSRLLLVASLGGASIAILLGAVVWSGNATIPVLYAVVLAVACGETISEIAGLSMLSSVVNPAELDRANSRLFVVLTLARQFAGPLLAGALFGVAMWVPTAPAVTGYLLCGYFALRLRGALRTDRTDRPQAEGIFKETWSGLRWLWADPALRALAVGGAARHFAMAAGQSILVLLAQDLLGLGGLGFGALLSAYAVGYVAGSAAAPKLTVTVSRLTITAGSVLAMVAAFVVVAVSNTAITAGIGLATVGAGAALWDVVAWSHRLAVVPDHVLGRVVGGSVFLAHGAMPFGALTGALIAGAFGLRAPFFAAAAVMLFSVPYLVPRLRSGGINRTAPR